MVALTFLAFAALFAPSVTAAPAQAFSVPHVDPTKFLCQLPILKKWVCPLKGTAALNRHTPCGTASGIQDPQGAYRFVVKYGNAARWAPSTVASTWTLPNGFTNTSALPLACPQPGLDPSKYSEDCLSMVLYVPPSLSLTSSAPTLVWVHGGSFVVGSATGVGLDGSKLAIATNSIVAVVQYRLGAFGFLAPNGQNNLGVKDVITALKFLKTVVPSFGGSSSKITLAGQSAGANMIRALLAVPSASNLFRTQNTLISNFTGQINCSGEDSACLNALSADTIINEGMNVFSWAYILDPAAGRNQPLRPVLDGSLVTSPLDSTGPFPAVSKPLLITSVSNEAGPAIYGGFPALPESMFKPLCEATFGPERAAIVVAQSLYSPVPAADGSVDARAQLQQVGTDYLWRCSGWTFARNWVSNGGKAYVGEYIVGATYPSNDWVSYCAKAGVVCHEDDIQIVFGTTPNPTSAQSSLATEMQQRYKAFLSNGNPNTVGVASWTAATATDVHPILLGGSGEAMLGACDPSFWGSGVQYDYQFYAQ
ncbi:hypothetical protein NLJ89_g1571 [Agrocybe chaxingu]|uniref:Carboxylic ester hydrolase n=1 Tax=Agrocybe chaxingu TaxID=84603 RepID=A0A9W8MZT5_9AGAR|nr:hypothetical protein NLJ89_g1571 [Agrocybe chaxingu]